MEKYKTREKRPIKSIKMASNSRQNFHSPQSRGGKRGGRESWANVAEEKAQTRSKKCQKTERGKGERGKVSRREKTRISLYTKFPFPLLDFRLSDFFKYLDILPFHLKFFLPIYLLIYLLSASFPALHSGRWRRLSKREHKETNTKEVRSGVCKSNSNSNNNNKIHRNIM